MRAIALTQQGIKELKRCKRFIVDPEAARKAAAIQKKEAVPVLLMNDRLEIVSYTPIGYALEYKQAKE